MAERDDGPQRNLRRGILAVEELHDDADGGVRVGVKSMSQRVIDLGYFAGFLSPEEYDAATRLRDNWERCRLVPDMKASALEALGRSESGMKALRAWDRHSHAMKAMGAAPALALTQMVLHDELPWQYGRRRGASGPSLLGNSLIRLTRYFENHEAMWANDD